MKRSVFRDKLQDREKGSKYRQFEISCLNDSLVNDGP